MNTIYINGIKTKFKYSNGGSYETHQNNIRNGLQAIFIWGKAINGRSFPSSEMTLPLRMFQTGGTCNIYGKEYKIKRAELT
tara:strand:- start:120 stop:362 length:243 start_codon:yes stop_codon:yes gene_type:complete